MLAGLLALTARMLLNLKDLNMHRSLVSMICGTGA